MSCCLLHFHIISLCDRRILLFIDVMGHVAEKDVLKDTEKNGKKSKVLDITLEDLE